MNDYSSCDTKNSVVYCEIASETMNLDNNIQTKETSTPKTGVDSMKYKINRKIIIEDAEIWIRANSEQEYAEKLLRFSGTVMGDNSPRCSGHNFTDYAKRWFRIYSEPNIATVTAKTYQRQLDLYLIPFFGNYDIENISPDLLQEFFNSVDRKKATKDKIKLVLNQILESSVEDDIIARNPLRSKKLKIKGGSSVETKPYSVEQMQYIAKHLGDIQNETDRIFMALQAFNGLRLEEVLGLMWSDIDLKNKNMNICRAVTHPTRNQPEIKETKTEKSTRQTGLSSIALPYLASFKNKSGFVIGGSEPISYTQVRGMCRRIQKNISFSDRITPIRFRTTVLTDTYDQTKDIKLTQSVGGHTNSSTTLKYYVKGREGISKAVNATDHLYSVV